MDLRWEEIKKISLSISSTRSSIHRYTLLFHGIVNAVNLGVPQTRRRVIILGIRDDLAQEIGSSKISLISDKVSKILRGENELFAKYPMSCIEVFEGKTIPQLAEKYKQVMEEYSDIIKTPSLPLQSAKWVDEIWNRLSFNIVKDYLMVNKIEPEQKSEFERAMEEHEKLLKRMGWFSNPISNLVLSDKSNEIPQEDERVLSRLRMIPPGENHEFVRGTVWEVEGKGMSLIYRRPFPLKPAPTVVAFGGGGTWGYHYDRGRSKLTNRERARLQTFTDDFAFSGTSTQIRAQIGEAVPPLLAMKIAEIIAEVLDT